MRQLLLTQISWAFFWSFLSFPSPVQAEETNFIRIGVYQGLVKRFPESKGIVWSDTLTDTIFSDANFAKVILEYPAKRLPVALSNDEIDIYVSSQEGVESYDKEFIASKFPVSMLTWYIYYDTNKGWLPVWPPDDEFRSKKGKSRRSSLSLRKKYALDISVGSTYDAMVKMVNGERIDYWVDNSAGIRSLDKSQLKSEAEGFIYTPLFSRRTYMYFQNTERGHMLREIYDKGCLEIIKSGRYISVFYKNDKNLSSTKTAEDTVAFIKQEFYELGIPDQVIPDLKK